MRAILRPSIFRNLLFILIAASAVVATLLMLANQAVRQATQSLEQVVEQHVRPLAAVYRLQAHMDALRKSGSSIVARARAASTAAANRLPPGLCAITRPSISALSDRAWNT